MSDCCPPVVDPLTFISLLGTIHKWRHAKNWNFDPKLSVRVGPNYEKLPDQAPYWSKVVPWYKEQYETLITQLS